MFYYVLSGAEKCQTSFILEKPRIFKNKEGAVSAMRDMVFSLFYPGEDDTLEFKGSDKGWHIKHNGDYVGYMDESYLEIHDTSPDYFYQLEIQKVNPEEVK